MSDFDTDYPDLDPGIRETVRILRAAGVETFESCEGGPGHAYPEPTVRLHGYRYAGWQALAVAQSHGLPVDELRRVWVVTDGEPTGPYWEITFAKAASIRCEAEFLERCELDEGHEGMHCAGNGQWWGEMLTNIESTNHFAYKVGEKDKE